MIDITNPFIKGRLLQNITNPLKDVAGPVGHTIWCKIHVFIGPRYTWGPIYGSQVSLTNYTLLKLYRS